MPSWKKVITSGSDAALNSLNVTNGITGSLLGTASLNYVDFSTTHIIGTTTPAWKEGRLFYDSGSGALALYNWEQDVTLNIGQEQWLRARNQTGVTITNGTVVRLLGAVGDRPTIEPAQSSDQTNTLSTGNEIIGMATHDIENGTDGFITTFGTVNGLNTSAYSAGTLLWVSQSAGQYTNVSPGPPFDRTFVGIVVRSNPSNGAIFVTPLTPIHFHDISSVSASIYQMGDLWMYRSGSVGQANAWINTKSLTGSYSISGSLTATSFTGSLLGTASYATQALSASYAPAGNPFPYNGNAQISGSLGVTGSFAVQTYDGIFANAFVDAIRISDGGRAIYDIFGTGSIDAGGRVLIDNMFFPSLGWLSRTMFDSTAASSINWNTRILYDTTGTTYSIDWNNRFLTDPAGLSSLDWSSRELLNSAGDAAITWNYLSQAQAVEINSYTRKTLELGTVVEDFSNLAVYTSFKPDGEILKGVALDASVVNFDLVYLNTDNKWYPVDVTTSSSSKLLGIAWGVGTGKETVLIEGNMVVAPASTGATDVPLIDNLDFGLPIYINTGGSFYMSTTAPGTSGNYVRVLGHAYYQGVAASDYWVMKFRPANDWYVI